MLGLVILLKSSSCKLPRCERALGTKLQESRTLCCLRAFLLAVRVRTQATRRIIPAKDPHFARAYILAFQSVNSFVFCKIENLILLLNLCNENVICS